MAAKVVLYGAVSVSAAVALGLGARRWRPERPAPWLLLAAGQAISAAADVTFSNLEVLLHRHAYPSPADVLYLAHYPLVAAGLVLLARSRTPGGDRASLLDALVIATGLGVLSWVFLIQPTLTASGQPLPARAVSIAYPIMDLLVLAGAARLVVGVGQRRPAFHLLVGAMAALLATDTAHSLLRLKGLHQIGSPGGRLLDAGWLCSYLLLGAAGLHPSMRAVTEPDLRSRTRLSPGRLALLAGVALLAPAVALVQDLDAARPGNPLVAVACAVLFLLVVVRMSGLLREVESNASELRLQGAALQTTLTDLKTALGDLQRVESERRRLLDKTVRGAEDERTRIAAELHDGPIQRLTVVGYHLEEAALALEARNGEHAGELLAAGQRELYDEIGQLRRLMTTLRPPALDQRGLTLALADQLEAFERRTGVGCVLQADRDTRVEPELETVLYRLVQEALTNVAKHAHARHVWVHLDTDDERVELHMRDDGIGFDPGTLDGQAPNGHFGLAGMRERVELVGGAYRLVSWPGRGTTISVRLPRRPARA